MKRVIFLVLGLILSLNISAFAQIKLDKYQVKADISSGEVIKGSIVVENTSAENITVKVYPLDFVYLPPFEGGKDVRPLGATSYSCGKWITASLNNFVLSPKGKQTVGYTIKAPENIKGGYYGVLFFEKGSVGSSGGVGVILKIGCSFFLEAQDKLREINIADTAIDKDTIKGKIFNSGNVILISDSAYYLMDEKGTILNKGKVREKFYLPLGEKVPFTVKVPNQLAAGSYTLVMNFDLEGRGALVKELDFSKDEAGKFGALKVKD